MMQRLNDPTPGNFTARQLRQLVDSRPSRVNRLQTSGSVKAVPEWEKAWSETVKKAQEGNVLCLDRPSASARLKLAL